MLMVKDYADLQAKKRAYIEAKLVGKQKVRTPREAREEAKRIKAKLKVKEKLKFEK
jgi:predicted RecB family endonuclease